MIVRFLRWACYFRAVRIPFTQWTVWLEPNRCGKNHPGGFFLDVDDKDGLIQLGTRWQLWMENHGPTWAERYAAWEAQQATVGAAE